LIEQIKFLDKSFNSNNINNYHLSLQISLKGFSLCLLDRERNKFIALENYYFDKITSYNILLEEIREIFNNCNILNQNYNHVKLLFTTPKFTFIPSPFFSEKEINTIFLFNHDIAENENIHTNYTYGNSSYTIFSIPYIVETFFKDKFSNLKVYHHSCPMIEDILLQSKLNDNKPKVYLNILPDIFDFIVIDNDNLKIFNTFSYTCEADFMYFILNTFNRLKLSPVETSVTISGIVKTNDTKIETLKKYIKQIIFARYPAHFDYAYGFNEIPEHYFINLINIYQCV
jgi:hypothetical protein